MIIRVMGILTMNFHSPVFMILWTKLSTCKLVRVLQFLPAINIGLILDFIKVTMRASPTSSRILFRGNCNKILVMVRLNYRSVVYPSPVLCILDWGALPPSLSEFCVEDPTAREQLSPYAMPACQTEGYGLSSFLSMGILWLI